MALADAIVGAKRPSQLVTWKDNDGNALNLTGATVTAEIDGQQSSGTFTIVDAEAGQFRWDYSTADVATAGVYSVRFIAAFGSEPSPAKTFIESWEVHE